MAKLARGKVREAMRELEAFDRLAHKLGRQAAFADELWRVRNVLSGMEAHALAVRVSERGIEISGVADADWGIPVALFEAGRTARAAEVQAAQALRYGADQMYSGMIGPAVDAAAAMTGGDFERAVEAFKRAHAFEGGNPFLQLDKGIALLRAGRTEDAVAGLEAAIANRFSAEPTAIYPVGRIWQARARAETGDIAGARRAYDDAFAFWKNADAEVPILVEARREYANLAAR